MTRPRTLFALAAAISAAYLASRLAGLAAHTSVLSGTLPDGAASFATSEALGAMHVLLHFSFVMVAPIFALAALLELALGALGGWARGRGKRKSGQPGAMC